MLEARLSDAIILKRLLDSIKELVTDANFECNEEGLKLQAMDNSHVALVSVEMKAPGFENYRCDRPMPLGVNLGSLTKVLKCAGDHDSCTLKATDDADVLNLTYESKNSDRIAEYDMKLMDIDADQLGIPDAEYDSRVTMSSSEFQRICRDLSQLGESVRIDVSKEGVRFVSDGEAANGNVLLKQTEAARRRYANYGESDDEDEGESSKKTKKVKEEVKNEEDAEMKDGEEKDEKEKEDDDEAEKEKEKDDGESEKDEDEDSDPDVPKNKKRKKAPVQTNGKTKKRKADKGDDEAGQGGGVSIEMNQAVSLTFSLKYLVNFAKSTPLSDTVQLMMSGDVPLLVSYKFGQGHIHYYLAPKIGDE